MQIWHDKNEKALAVIQEASQELLSRGLIVDSQIFHSAVQHQTLHALGEYYELIFKLCMDPLTGYPYNKNIQVFSNRVFKSIW